MKKDRQKKLELSRETLKMIDSETMKHVVAAAAGCTSTAGPPCEDK